MEQFKRLQSPKAEAEKTILIMWFYNLFYIMFKTKEPLNGSERKLIQSIEKILGSRRLAICISI